MEGAGGPEILVVVDKLLTGFDAPIEQALYLDKHLQEHSLLQAIARVNRTFSHEVDGAAAVKQPRPVVDYHGVSQNLETALAGFDWEDVRDSMIRLEQGRAAEEMIEEAAARAESHFRACGLDDLWACAAVFAPDRDTEGRFKIDLYQRFNRDYRQFSALMDRFLPDEGALRFLGRAGGGSPRSVPMCGPSTCGRSPPRLDRHRRQGQEAHRRPRERRGRGADEAAFHPRPRLRPEGVGGGRRPGQGLPHGALGAGG